MFKIGLHGTLSRSTGVGGMERDPADFDRSAFSLVRFIGHVILS